MRPQYLGPYFQRQQVQVHGIDPMTGLHTVGFAPAIPLVAQGGRALVQRMRDNRAARARCGEDGHLGWDGDDDELGADDFDELDDLDDEIGGIDDDDDDELGASPRRTKRKLKRAEKTLAKIDRKLDRLPAWRKRKRRKLNERKDKVKDKIRDLKADLRAGQGGGGGGRVRATTPEESAAAAGLQEVGVRSYPAVRTNQGVYLGAPPAGGTLEFPVEFTGGSRLFEATIAAATGAGTQAAFAGETKAYTYLDLQVVGIKVTAFMNAPLMDDGAATPLGIAIVEQSAQLAVVMQNLTVDGGLNMFPDDQIMNLGGKFGSSNEETFSGLRLDDIVFQNGKVEIAGVVEVAFDAAQAYDISLKMSVLANIVRDRRVRGN